MHRQRVSCVCEENLASFPVPLFVTKQGGPGTFPHVSDVNSRKTWAYWVSEQQEE